MAPLSALWTLGMTQNSYIPLSEDAKQLSLLTFPDTPAGIEFTFRTDGEWTEVEGQTDVEVEIVV